MECTPNPDAAPTPPLGAREEHRALLLRIVQSLVDHPEAVQVAIVAGTHLTLFEVSVASVDMKRVIGSGGRTSDGLRRILRAWSGRTQAPYLLDIVEPTHLQDEAPASPGIPVAVVRRRPPPPGARRV